MKPETPLPVISHETKPMDAASPPPTPAPASAKPAAAPPAGPDAPPPATMPAAPTPPPVPAAGKAAATATPAAADEPAKANLSLNVKPSEILPLLNKYRGTATFLVVVALFTYTGYQISKITSVQPIVSGSEQKIPSLKINRTTLDQLKSLQPSGGTPSPTSIGKQNPFVIND